MPDSRTASRSAGMSSQPQRRGRPVVAPNSAPTSRSRSPVASQQLGRERAVAHPGGVGLHDAQHLVDQGRADAAGGAGPAGGGRRRGDVRVGAVIEVEQHALGAFEQDVLAGLDLLVQEARGVAHERAGSPRRWPGTPPRSRPGRGPGAPSSRSSGRHRRAGCAPAPARKRSGSDQILDPHARCGRPCSRRWGRCRAWCCRWRPAAPRGRRRCRGGGAAPRAPGRRSPDRLSLASSPPARKVRISSSRRARDR